MTERENLSKPEIIVEYVTAGLSGIVGGAMGILGALAENRVLSQTNPNLHDVVFTGLVTFVGASLVLNGGARYYRARKASIEQSQRE